MCCCFPESGRSLLWVKKRDFAERVCDPLGCHTNAGRTFHTCCSPAGPSPSFYGAFKCQSGVCLCFSRALRNPGRRPSCRSTAHFSPQKNNPPDKKQHIHPHSNIFSPPLPPSAHSSLVFFLFFFTFNSAPPRHQPPQPPSLFKSSRIAQHSKPFLSFPSCVTAPPGAPVVFPPATEVWKLPRCLWPARSRVTALRERPPPSTR